MFVFFYSSYHQKVSFPHLVVILTTLEKPKNIFSFNNNIMQNDNAAGIRGQNHESSDCFEYPPKNPYLNQAAQKILAKFSYPKKSRNRKFQTIIPVTWIRGLCPIFHRAVLLCCENVPLFVRYSPKQVAKLCSPVALDFRLITRAGAVTPLDLTWPVRFSTKEYQTWSNDWS